MFQIKIAELIIRIDNKYEYVSYFCEQHKINTDQEDFAVSAIEEEILRKQADGEEHFSFPYCERLLSVTGNLP